MKMIKCLGFISIAATLSACGSNFEWFPKTTDSTAPTISATIAGNSLFNNRTTHVPAASFPATVTFYATEAATIYYTTNGSEPTTTSSTVDIPGTTGVSGPLISLSSTILKFFGIDKLANSSSIQTNTIKSP